MEKKRRGLREVLREDPRFSEEELKHIPRSFDIVGQIALIQIPFGFENKEKIIGETLLRLNKNVKTVYSKGKFYGRLRKQRIKLIAGRKLEETTYKEANCLIKMNIRTCYFTTRLATDRLDIARQVKSGESVLVMFSGVAPYGLVVAKNSKAKKVVCIEINREATKYAKENILINKLKNVEAIQGDVKKICPKLAKEGKKFDRIIMGRPQLKETFLKEAFMMAKKGTIIHFQDFIKQQDLDKEVQIKRVKDAAKKARKKVKIFGTKILRELAPYKYNVRVDFKIV